MSLDGWVYPLGNGVIRAALGAFARCRVEGVEAVPPFGPLLVVSNHLSLLDPPLLAVTVPRRLHYLAKESVFRTPPVRWLLRGYGAFPVARRGHDVRGMRWVQGLLQRDLAVALFPEGTRRPGGLRRPVPGVVRLHLATRAPVLPVGITGTEHIRSIPRIFLPTGDITVRIGSPFTLPEIEGRPARAQIAALGDIVMRRVADLLPVSYRGEYAQGAPGERGLPGSSDYPAR